MSVRIAAKAAVGGGPPIQYVTEPESLRVRLFNTFFTAYRAMNRFACVAMATAFALSAYAEPVTTEILETPHYLIKVERNCPDNYVTCEDVSYVGRNKSTGQTISLTGRTLHSLCADKITPCRFEGYEFKNGRYKYFLGIQGYLVVRLGSKTVFEEKGEWR
jgi:hypothetical protein